MKTEENKGHCSDGRNNALQMALGEVGMWIIGLGSQGNETRHIKDNCSLTEGETSVAL